MYGQIHVCVRSLVLRKFGEEAWKAILDKSGVDDIDDFLVFHRYPDELSLKLVGAVAEVAGIPVPTVLEVFGEFFLLYCMEVGYDKMLRTLGEDFRSFIQNLDSLHSLLALTYKELDAPSFRCDEVDEKGDMLLHYYSSRPGFHPIVSGLLRAVGTHLFDITVGSDVVDISEQEMADGKKQHHVIFKVSGVLGDSLGTSVLEEETNDNKIALPEETIITAEVFCDLFPFHIVFDMDLVIRQCGVNIQKMAYLKGFVGKRVDEVFTLEHPKMPLTIDHILNFIMANYVLEVKLVKSPKKKARYSKLVLKGSMIHMADIRYIIFIGSPRLESLNEMQERNMYLSDIPLYDVTRELILLNQQRIAEIEVSKKLDEASAELKRLTFALDSEKKKTDALLYQMLPVKIADQLRDGKRADAEKFDQVTIFFSDIVTFTNIAAAVKPIQIVSLLNELYSRLDLLTETHGVYKVETIGDAYMVVGGIPEASKIHAQCVANFAIDMVEKSREVISPASGNPIQVRVGLHSGPVVAGVVGDKMPRYCLFGDTVNTASRMESHGVPSKIHVSPTTYNHLKNEGYKFESRGKIEVKGKGLMETFFLRASPDKEAIWMEEEAKPEPGVAEEMARKKSSGQPPEQELITGVPKNGTKEAKPAKSSRPSSGKNKSSTCTIF